MDEREEKVNLQLNIDQKKRLEAVLFSVFGGHEIQMGKYYELSQPLEKFIAEEIELAIKKFTRVVDAEDYEWDRGESAWNKYLKSQEKAE